MLMRNDYVVLVVAIGLGMVYDCNDESLSCIVIYLY